MRRELKQARVHMRLTEPHVEMAFDLADRVGMLDQGTMVCEGGADALRDNPIVQAASVGLGVTPSGVPWADSGPPGSRHGARERGSSVHETPRGKAVARGRLPPRVAPRAAPHIQQRVALPYGAAALPQPVVRHGPEPTLVAVRLATLPGAPHPCVGGPPWVTRNPLGREDLAVSRSRSREHAPA